MSRIYPVEQWVIRRRQGHTQTEIAANYGVSASTVARYTAWAGPFISGRSQRHQTRHAQWANDRLAGLTTAQIAARDGVTPETVSRATRDLGPYPGPRRPDPADIAGWAEQRRHGVSIAVIAAAAATSEHVVAAATRDLGPYPRPAGAAPGQLCRADLERILRLSAPAVARWARTGFLPAPTGVTDRGRPYWDQAVFRQWMDSAGLQVCPQCGAHTKNLRSHQVAAHPAAPPSGREPPDWVGDADAQIAIVKHVAPKTFEGAPTYVAHTDPQYEVAEKHLRWAVWCVESLYQLRDLIDLDDPRGDNHTPLGHRADPTTFGHIMWAAVTAMGALDRVAAAFGALHLGLREDGTVYGFNLLWRDRRKIKHEPIRAWMRTVRDDPAYTDVLNVLRNPLVHRITRRSLYASVGSTPPYNQRRPHHDATKFYIGDTDQAISVIELLEEVIPLTENHVRAALALLESHEAFPPDDPRPLP